MSDLIDWYFEKCRISAILLVGAVVWAVAACLMLGEFAPAAYVGLHAITTGVFTFAIMRVKQSADGDPNVAAPTSDKKPAVAPAVQKQSA